MKHTLALIATCCALISFNGCAKMKGDCIGFGHSYPCKLLRGNVYYITLKEDVPVILEAKENAAQGGGCNGKDSERGGFLFPHCNNIYHRLLQYDLQSYHEGFLGWV